MSAVIERQLEQLPRICGMQARYRLRWRFMFANRPDKVGGWDHMTQDPKEMAAYVNKDTLLCAAIEGEKIGYWTVHRLFECDGHQYATARWEVAVGTGGWGRGEVTVVPSKPLGLTFCTATHAATVWVNGEGRLLPLSEYDKQFDITEHRLGSGK